MTDDYTRGLDEIKALRARLANLEAIAAATPPRAGMESALADHYSPLKPPVDRKTRDLRNAAHGWQPDDSMEQAIKAHDRDPAAYDAEMRRVGASNGLEMALYTRQRAAALALNPDALKETK
jgi:hypothetical protein